VNESTNPQIASAARLIALRGATTVESDQPEPIVAATAELLKTLLERNGAAPGDLVSVVFTATPDLRAEFPAAAARRLGWDDVPLLCAREINVEGAVERCVRVLIHLYSKRPRDQLHHVYLEGARRLRSDLQE
jgi:chorismate mutase